MESCAVCKERTATLRNDDESWICEDCAQSMNDLSD
ncbi:phosphonoacetate hydrolase [Virgibacillus subterraneus]|uniref:Phosphonoacetate hydrolase n=1 Tax=Virgibacillus subterraneus TaxID=621109 RepID=A0A1H8YYR2_9BACI|nr:phosphonoacetate hydrolase [Virgibacillus subterraneus]